MSGWNLTLSDLNQLSSISVGLEAGYNIYFLYLRFQASINFLDVESSVILLALKKFRQLNNDNSNFLK